MERAKRHVGQTFRRIGHNLVNSRKDDDGEIRNLQQLETRNTRIVNAISAYRKNVASCIKTGLKEENVEKRKKKLDEFALSNDLRDAGVDLMELESKSTCLGKVMESMSLTIQSVVEEKVRLDKSVETHVIDHLAQYLEMEKTLSKNREKLAKSLTDLEIAKKDFDKENSPQLQEAVDAAHSKLENQKDSSITEIYSMASKEQEIAKTFICLLELQLEFHRTAMRTIEMALPDMKVTIENSWPRPVFGVDLTGHLRHSRGTVAVVLEKCCTILRKNGMKEKGVFRISGNNAKIKRMKAAFDAGQIDNDAPAYEHDPHSVCSVLKSYLRELPNPLLTNELHNDWVQAAEFEGEERLKAIESCLRKLPDVHLHNLTYLIHFLVELLKYHEYTSMNASNLAIVFGPNLLGGNIEGNNVQGTKIVETFLCNANRLFGIPVDYDTSSGNSVSLNIDTGTGLNSSFRRPNSASPYVQSPRTRPKEKAPPPPNVPPQDASYSDSSGALIDLSDDFSDRRSTGPSHAFLSDHFANGSHRHPSIDSDDSFDEYDDDQLQRSGSLKPIRPPPPAKTNRTSWIERDPISINTSYAMPERSEPTKNHENLLGRAPRNIKRPTILPDDSVGITDFQNRTVVSVGSESDQAPLPPARASKPPLPAKPKPDDKETCRL